MAKVPEQTPQRSLRSIAESIQDELAAVIAQLDEREAQTKARIETQARSLGDAMRIALDLDRVDLHQVQFVSERDPAEVPTLALRLIDSQWEALGSPEVITVTIAPGDGTDPGRDAALRGPRGRAHFESPLMPMELADAPDIDNVPAAESMHTLMGAVVEMHQDVRQVLEVVLKTLPAARAAQQDERGVVDPKHLHVVHPYPRVVITREQSTDLGLPFPPDRAREPWPFKPGTIVRDEEGAEAEWLDIAPVATVVVVEDGAPYVGDLYARAADDHWVCLDSTTSWIKSDALATLGTIRVVSVPEPVVA